METAITLYVIFSSFVFLYAVHTALEDTTIMRSHGEEYPNPSLKAVIGILFASFVPVVNVALLGMTFMYRSSGP